MRESLHFQDAVAAALESLPPDTICLASVSGGADSTAMLVALAALGERRRVRCIHVEHGIRPSDESRGDAGFVRSLCEKYRIPCRVVSVKPGRVAETAGRLGVGIEAAARLYRHRAWFREAARLEAGELGQARILVAHTADDMLETVLMRVLRGAGPSGLAAMPSCRGRILRPLLALSRRDVLDYLALKDVPWRQDSTNADTRYLRNRVRHRLVPVLAADFPRWRTAVSSLAETQSLAADFIVSEANRRVKWQPLPDAESFTEKPGAELRTDEANFFAQPAIVREEALFQGIDALLADPRAIAHEVKRSNVRRFSGGKVSALDLGRVRLRRKDGIIVLSRHKSAPSLAEGKINGMAAGECGFSLLIIAPGFYTLKGITLEVGRSGDAGEAAFFASLPLVLRPSFKEDRIGRARGGDGKVVSAVDSQGIAAFIGMNGLLERRSDTPRTASESPCVVKAGNRKEYRE